MKTTFRSFDTKATDNYNKLLAAYEREYKAMLAAAEALGITPPPRLVMPAIHLRPDDGGDDPWETED